MKKIITYGTFDLLHQGHINLLRRAKALGDWLIVGVTTDKFDQDRGKLNTCDDLMTRIEAVKKTGYADQIVLEEYKGQKIDDIRKYGVDIFAIGSDWEGYFDYLKEFCEVVYLPRTEGISSSQLREGHSPVRIGLLGDGNMNEWFTQESKPLHGIEIVSATPDSGFETCDAVYVGSSLEQREDQVKAALHAGKHVLCELPVTTSTARLEELFRLADEKQVILMPACRTANCPGFGHLYTLLKSGVIGEIMDMSVILPVPENPENLFAEYASLALLPIAQFLGTDYRDVTFYSKMRDGVEIFTKGVLRYDHAVATFQMGLGAKPEGVMTITGTKGHALVHAPWWKTDDFEIRDEDRDLDKKYFYPFVGEGLRYELKDFVSSILQGTYQKVSRREWMMMVRVQEAYWERTHTFLL